ncbi:hypothetical protein EGW08_007903 [Elysia chlorotica]|uniref:Uncharacterized protein n=1 Tax=Elysia chlorotica TaxID=188477 RepID=A0A433TS63_ELYCH|nr:hypothetical protein EGW08_007903 [Elysia chlorotica]
MMESSGDAPGGATRLMMEESSTSSTDSSSQSYRDPPVLEPEPPIISPSGSRRSSLDSPDAFSVFFPPPSKLSSLSSESSCRVAAPPRRSRSVEDEHLSHGQRKVGMRQQLFPSLSSSAAHTVTTQSAKLCRNHGPDDALSKSDGYQYRRRKGCGQDVFDQPPLLRRDHYDSNAADESVALVGKHEPSPSDRNVPSSPHVEIKPRGDLHPSKRLTTAEAGEDALNHYHVGEDIYLKQKVSAADESVNNDEVDVSIRRQARGRGRKRSQPRLIFRMKKDPELKKLLRAESAHSPNLQFKWDDDDSDPDLGSSPAHRTVGDRVSPSQPERCVEDGGQTTLISAPSLAAANVNCASLHQPPSKKRVRKVRLKMIDTSLNFDLVSPPLSPHK